MKCNTCCVWSGEVGGSKTAAREREEGREGAGGGGGLRGRGLVRW